MNCQVLFTLKNTKKKKKKKKKKSEKSFTAVVIGAQGQ